MSSDVHGRKRERTTADIIKARREREATKITEYNNWVKECHDRIQNGQYDVQSLRVTTQILHMNPDYYTMWNIRRTILQNGILQKEESAVEESNDEEKNQDIHSVQTANQNVYLQELDLFMQLIRINPKSYWLWNHRCWCLESMPHPSWNGELKLVDKMLTMDERNFHGWNYRRYVVRQLRRLATSKEEEERIVQREYEFTTEKIGQSFSNYSAWHQRSKLLPEIVAKMSSEERNAVAQNELEMVNSAIFVEPDDQSAWLYYWWLIGKAPAPVVLVGAFQLIHTSHIIIGFDDVVGLTCFPKVMTTNGSTPLEGQWYAINPPAFSNSIYGSSSNSSVWLFVSEEVVDQPAFIELDASTVHPNNSAKNTEQGVIWKKDIKKIDSTDSITALINQTVQQGDTPKLIRHYNDFTTKGVEVWYSLDRVDTLKKEIALVRELLEIEPDSKWALKTLVHFLQQLKLHLVHQHRQQKQEKDHVEDDTSNKLDDESTTILDRLIELDTYRKARYSEAKDQIIAQRKLYATFARKQDQHLELLLYLLQLA